jgi:serine/threonine-protein kinase
LALYPIDKSPEVLEDRARQIAVEAGYSAQPADRAWWFSRNYSYLLYRNRMKMSSPKGPISGSNPGALGFVYRQSPEPMIHAGGGEKVDAVNPPYETSGMVLVLLDSLGRLREFRAVPRQDAAGAAVQEPNWAEIFREAGLDLNRFKTAAPKWLPNEPFDLRRDWEGTYDGDDTLIHVSAASHAGKPVMFRVIPPWITSPDWSPEKTTSNTGFIQLLSIVGGGSVMIIIAVFFARKNIRLGRGDRKGAFRLATYFFLADVAARLLLAHHVPVIGAELNIVTLPIAISLLGSAVLWIYYIAIEPYVRRQWPEFLISWTRLLGGNVRDPMVGRDLLAGCLIGALLALCEHVVNALPAWFNLAGQTPINGDGAQLATAAQFAGVLFGYLAIGIFRSLTVLFLYVLLRNVIKNHWGAAILLGLLLTLTYLGSENPVAETIGAVIMATLTVIALLRFGLLAVAVAYTTLALFLGFPVALDPSRWYFARGLVPVLLFSAMALYGFRTSLGRQPVFGRLIDE